MAAVFRPAAKGTIRMSGTSPTRERPPVWARRRPERAVDPLRVLQLGLWSVLHAVFYFLQQIAELLAPLLLVVGVGWWALPRVVGAMSGGSIANADPQAKDLLGSISGSIPAGLNLAGHWITPGSLIVDGLLLMALAAVGATVAALAARGM